ncbi:clan AA aspartic protease [Armatimonas rosea]|uniref:Clan AA aspartic protease n=1 Tax=Armatimonas rosea TaxID=685828 RepID=A0A7W9SQR0_ARMRO|nr:clan AA aspartic protease [Armatimonas rosea]
MEFVVDTGFEGALALPLETIAQLKLPFELELDSVLADGNAVPTPVHSATILWQNKQIDVAILGLGERPLLGTALLADYRLTVDFFESGQVTVLPITV